MRSRPPSPRRSRTGSDGRPQSSSRDCSTRPRPRLRPRAGPAVALERTAQPERGVASTARLAVGTRVRARLRSDRWAQRAGSCPRRRRPEGRRRRTCTRWRPGRRRESGPGRHRSHQSSRRSSSIRPLARGPPGRGQRNSRQRHRRHLPRGTRCPPRRLCSLNNCLARSIAVSR